MSYIATASHYCWRPRSLRIMVMSLVVITDDYETCRCGVVVFSLMQTTAAEENHTASGTSGKRQWAEEELKNIINIGGTSTSFLAVML